MQRYTALPQDPDAAPGINTLYNGFNDLGQMAGFELSTTHEIPAWAATLGWQPYQSFVYSSHVDNWDNFMPATPGAFVSEAVGINDEGVIVGINNTGTGDQGYMLADGKLKSIDAVATPTPTGSLPTGSTTDPAGLNNMGKIVGDFYDSKTPYKQQGFVYDVHTETFSRVNYHGNLYTEFNGVNDSGQIVGFTTNDPTESTAHGLFVDVNGEMSVVDYPGAVFTSNNGISNDGQIAGEYLDSNGIWHAFVATPIRNLRTPVRDNDR